MPDLPILNGQLLLAGTAEYESARTRNFALNAHDPGPTDHGDTIAAAESSFRRTPTYIAIVQSVRDVQQCLQFAHQNGATVSVRTGGHNWFGCYLQNRGTTGKSTTTMLIDLHHLDHISEIDPLSRTVSVGPAALGQEVNRCAAPHALCFPSGHCVGVSLGGYLLGGGLGWFAPCHGYASESIVKMVVVDARGNLVECASNDDWMWLARGSACAFPGVVVSFTLQLHPLPPVIRTKGEFYPLEDYEAILRHVYQYVTDHPQLAAKTEMALVLTETPAFLVDTALGPLVALFKLSVMASSEEESKEILAPLCGEVGKFPSVSLGGESAFERHESFETLPETTRLAYPSGHHWLCRSYISDLSRFDSMDWSEFRRTFVQTAPNSSADKGHDHNKIGNHNDDSTAAVSTLVHTTVLVAPERPVSLPGCYGSCTPGITVLVSGAYQVAPCETGPATCSSSGYTAEATAPARIGSNAAKTIARAKMQRYVNAMHELLDPFAARYDVVEHPVHRDTFHKSYPETCAEQILALRSQLDPDRVFWDPSQADPYP
jgi:FAD binding domain